MGILKNDNVHLKTAQEVLQDKIDVMGDMAPTKHYIPRLAERKYELNDIYVKPKKKTKIIFEEADMKYPNLIEAIRGGFKILPIFKKEGTLWVEITE